MDLALNILMRFLFSCVFFVQACEGASGGYAAAAAAGPGSAGPIDRGITTFAKIDTPTVATSSPSKTSDVVLPHPKRYAVLTPDTMFGGVGPIPPAIKQPGMKDPEVDFFKGIKGKSTTYDAYKRYAETFFNTPVTQYKPDLQRDVMLLRGELNRRPKMYLSTYKNIKAFLLQARSTPGAVSLERRDEKFFLEEGLTADEEKRLMSELQGARMPLGDGLLYDGFIIGHDMADAIEGQRSRIFQLRKQMASLKERVRSLGGQGYKVFDEGRNYAVFTLCIISGDTIYPIPLPALFSSGLAPIGIPGVEFNYDPVHNTAGLFVPEFDGNTLYYFDSMVGKALHEARIAEVRKADAKKSAVEKTKAHRNLKKVIKDFRKIVKSLKKADAPDWRSKEADLKTMVGKSDLFVSSTSKMLAERVKRTEKIYEEKHAALLEKTNEMTAGVYSRSHEDFPHSTRDAFSQKDFMEGKLEASSDKELEELKRSLAKAYTHSEQAILQYLKRTKWLEKEVRKFAQNNPHIRIDGVVGLYGTLRDACANCAKAIAINGYHDIYVAGVVDKKTIPYTTVISGFKPYEQHALVRDAEGKPAYTRDKKSRDPEIGVTYSMHMDLKKRKVAIYAGPPYE